MTDEVIKKDNKSIILYGILLFIFVITYSFVWLNKAFPMAEGWAQIYSGLIEKGKTPYKDFYYYLPPLNLLIDYIFWKLSFGFVIVYRLWRLTERLLIAGITYKLLVKKVNPFISFLTVFISIVIGTSCCYDLIGDYNQTEMLLVLFLGLPLLKYVSKTNNIKQYKIYLVLSGFIGGLMFLLKQPIVLSSFLVFSVIIIILYLFKIEKNILQVFGYVFLGASFPLILAFIYFLHTNSFNDFINQVYIDLSAKSSLYNIIIQKLIICIKSKIRIIIACITLSICYFKQFKFKNLIIILSILYLIKKHYPFFLPLDKNINSVYIIFLSSIIFIPFIIFTYKNIIKQQIVYIISFCILFAFLYYNINNISSYLYTNTTLTNMIKLIPSYIFITIIAWCFYYIYVTKKNNLSLKSNLLIYVGMGLASSWSTLMSSGENIVESRAAFVSLPVLVYILSNEKIIKNSKINKLISITVFQLLFLLIFSISLSSKLVCSYDWWGGRQPTIWEKTENSDLKPLTGFKLSLEEKIKYDEITKVIKSNSNNKSSVFSFPYGTPYNLLANNFNIAGFVPIIFYDVCSDNYAELQANYLNDNKPDIFIWINIPYCLNVHEKIFRQGNICKQRKIIEWFERVKDTNYELIGQASNVLVFKLKNNGIPTNYKFFEKKELESNPEKVKIEY